MNKRRLSKAIKRLKNLPINRALLLYTANKVKHIFLKAINSTKVAYPSTVMIELTNQCNLKCTICPREYQFGKEMDKGSMAIDNAKAIVDELWPYLDSIGLTGMGETFMFREINEIVDYIKEKNKGIIISVSTNAVLPHFNEKIIGLINKIDTIQISIDGIDSVYESIRVGASFSILDQNIRSLVDLCKGTQTILMLNMVVTKQNYTHMPLLVEYANRVGVQYLDFTLLNLASVTNIDVDYYDFYQSKEFKDAVHQLNSTVKEHPAVTVTGRNFKTHNSFRKCPFPWTHFYITWDGFVVPCCAKPFPKEMNFGNVLNRKVIDVLNSNDHREFRRMWFANKPPKFCERCHFIHIEPV